MYRVSDKPQQISGSIQAVRGDGDSDLVFMVTVCVKVLPEMKC